LGEACEELFASRLGESSAGFTEEEVHHGAISGSALAELVFGLSGEVDGGVELAL
jgi:hypothetical protein